MDVQQDHTLGLEVSLSTLAREFGLARETVKKRLAAGSVRPSGRNKGNDVYRMGEAARAIIAFEYGGVEVNKDPDKMQPKEMLDHYKGQNEKIKFDRDSGRLVEVDDHRIVVADMAKILMQEVETLPDMLEQRCGLSADEVELVENAINTARDSLAEKLENYELC